MTSRALLVVAIGASMSFAATTSADELFSNFGPGDSFQSDQGWAVGDTENLVHASAMPAVVGGDFFLESITAAVSHVSGANSAMLIVWDDAGGVPGSILEQVTGGGFGASPTNDVATKFDFAGTTILQEGETYWVGMSAPAGATVIWNWIDDGNDPATFLPLVTSVNNGGWNPRGNAPAGVFRVEGTQIPAPGALAMLGLASIVVTRRRHQ